MKILNPKRKTDVIVQHLHHFQSPFDSVFKLRAVLVDELKEQVPDSTTFGYMEGNKNKMTSDDLRVMYTKHNSGEVTLCMV